MEAIKPQLDVARAEAIRWLGDWHPLVRQIAAGEGVAHAPTAGSPHAAPALVSVGALHAFLLNYKVTVLLPFELPVVKQACEHTIRNEIKELLELDRHLSKQPWFEAFKQDSRTAGRLHLERLKPLRDHRGVRRYLTAVEAGKAAGWHLLVAGVALGLYSLPLRQGLMDYALHTFWDVLGKASETLNLKRHEAVELVNDLSADLPRQIQQMFPPVEVTAV